MIKTAYRIFIFFLKYIWNKLTHFSGFSLSSFSALQSRCRWTSEFAVIGKSKFQVGRIETASYTRLAAVGGGNLKVGNQCFFNRNCTVICRNQITIGKACTFGPNVCIYDHDHEFGANGQTGHFKLGNVEIGDNCWFGAGVIILKDTKIGNNCVVGAGCIVKGNIPDNSIVSMERKITIKSLHD